MLKLNNNNNNNNNPHLTRYPVLLHVSVTPVVLPATQEIRNGVTQILSFQEEILEEHESPYFSGFRIIGHQTGK